MQKATHASLTLVRFDDLREAGPLMRALDEDVLFLQAGADFRAAGTTLSSGQAFKYAIYGLHTNMASAQSAVERRLEIAPWIENAKETWAAVLLPFRQFGEANFIDATSPCPQFEIGAQPPGDGEPVVIVTSVGWNSAEGEAMDRIKRFSDGVAAVRIGMTGLNGLHSQQSFSFPGGLVHDGITVTIWKSVASAMAFAYGPGRHRMEVKTQREELYGDRTSFTRFRILHSEGTWHDSDPLQT
ncbi:MAG: hypothetical protein JSS66_17505 [Armatimonadetes bacterium]|nr:hypothetical protein [Armatimonadota bacterium]